MGDTGTRPGPFAGAVLAGGRSSRMGRDKAFVELDGRPMAGLVLDALRRAGADPVVAVGGDLDALVGLGFDDGVADRFPGDGPLGGLVTALGAATTDLVVVLGCDMPWVTAEAIAALVAALATDAKADVAVGDGDRVEPLLAVWRTKARPLVGAAFADGVRSLQGALARLTVRLVPIADPQVLRSANRPGDLPG